ncbi:MAG: hypothetical protein US95_C0023G0005 [Candidatus Woesebacteria bacterium GW2011_GWB1_38_5]|uniref:Uncharacterized protein n=3 Tax=Candidatus Woeseibacteriota TaxID=1752722 RepID=A0A0G0K453_9BACT|nr:MAG: hypothetical protein US67_C0040G0008 [Candidatus Woesebacteria bacterium GW2011_GWD1_38_10]KKQ55717.1 MAG: hypothetical protein US75_C0015G0013 [Candidatus Woesebacteria bacterium GW2011_GWC1_38_13]KKQ74508.1 MAG: hypothetical protein US95_C0023G0005 [Candidatus Woesebacteria bacterium GW2011_GWB1_38_5]
MERLSSRIRKFIGVKDVIGSFRPAFLTGQANRISEVKTGSEPPTYDLPQSSEFYQEDYLEEKEDRDTFLMD